MPLDPQFFDRVLTSSPKEAWDAVLGHAWETCAALFVSGSAEMEITRREHAIADVDHFLATAGWDLWKSYEQTAPLASGKMIKWWHDRPNGKAVLILDALSLRECPWLLSQAESRGFCFHEASVAGAELPADTVSFAKALGFPQRSALSNNGAGGAHRLAGARTESTDISWQDCANLIGAEPNWVFWHHWPDSRLHDYDAPGRGLASLVKETEAHLTGDEFWHFVERLCVGRRVVITADHGYAASGNFPDSNKEQTEYLRGVFGNGRWKERVDKQGAWVPPLDLLLETRHGKTLFVNGRRKWKNAGGYPTLTHGGLTVLEVAVPWIEISK